MVARRKRGSVAQGFDHAASVGDARARNIERRAMVYRGADDRQPDRDVDARLKAQYLDRPVALVMVHRHHEVEVSAAGAEEHRVRRQRTQRSDSLTLSALNRRYDCLLLLTAAE